MNFLIWLSVFKGYICSGLFLVLFLFFLMYQKEVMHFLELITRDWLFPVTGNLPLWIDVREQAPKEDTSKENVSKPLTLADIRAQRIATANMNNPKNKTVPCPICGTKHFPSATIRCLVCETVFKENEEIWK